MDPAEYRPWEGRWQVCFVPARLHPFFRLLQRLRGKADQLAAPFQHVFLLQPLDGERWLLAEWTLMQHTVTVIGRPHVARLHAIVQSRGALLEFFGAEVPPRPHLWPALLPTSCVCFVRSVMGLPPRSFLMTVRELWYELLDLGAIVLIDLPKERKSCPSAAAAAATMTPSGR